MSDIELRDFCLPAIIYIYIYNCMSVMYFNPVVFKGIFVQLGLLPSSNMHVCKHGLRSGHQKLDPRNGSTNTKTYQKWPNVLSMKMDLIVVSIYIHTKYDQKLLYSQSTTNKPQIYQTSLKPISKHTKQTLNELTKSSKNNQLNF